jgi:hypothetical protein
MFSHARRLAVVALLVATSPAHAMVEQVPTIDPLKTSCAAFVKRTRQNSVGRFVFAINLLPVTGNSPFGDQGPDGPNLYSNMVGLDFIPIDPKSYAAIVKHKAPVWMFLSFDTNPAAAGTLRRNIAFAASGKCQAGDNQYTALDSVPLEIKRELLSALTDLRNGGKGDPNAISDDESTRISRLFPASVDAELQAALKGLE